MMNQKASLPPGAFAAPLKQLAVLLSINLRVMTWPLAALLISGVVFFFPGTKYSDPLQILATLISLTGFVLTPVILFGQDYLDGTKGYTATRPIPPTRNLFVRVTLLFIYSVITAIFVDSALSFVYDNLTYVAYERMLPITWAVLFSFALWCGGAVILTGDPVRGLLYGSMLFICPILFLWILSQPFYSITSSIQDAPAPSEIYYHRDYQRDDILLLGLLFLSPSVMLALLISVSKSVVFQKVRVTMFSGFLLLAGIAYYLISLWSIKIDTIPFTYILDSRETIFAVNKTTQRLYKCFYRATKGQTNLIKLSSIDQPGKDLKTFEAPKGFWSYFSFNMNDRYLLLYGRIIPNTYFLNVYDIQQQENTGSPMKIEQPGDLENIFIYDTSRVILSSWIYAPTDDSTRKSYYREDLVNLVTGLTEASVKKDVTAPHNINLFDNLSYRPTFDAIRIYRRLSDMSDVQAGMLPFLPYSFVETGVARLAVFRAVHDRDSPTGYRIGDYSIHLFDLSSLEKPIERIIPIPIRMYLMPEIVLRILGSLGLKNKNENQLRYYTAPRLAGGNGILCYEYASRVAFWDFRDFDHIKFIGISQFPDIGLERTVRAGPDRAKSECVILRKENGATGFVNDRGISWLEFPALMGEGQL